MRRTTTQSDGAIRNRSCRGQGRPSTGLAEARCRRCCRQDSGLRLARRVSAGSNGPSVLARRPVSEKGSGAVIAVLPLPDRLESERSVRMCQASWYRPLAANTSSPVGSAGEGATGARVPTPQPFSGAVARPNRGCLSAPALGVLWATAASNFIPPALGRPAGGLGWLRGCLEPRFSVGAIAGSPAVADAAVPLEHGEMRFS